MRRARRKYRTGDEAEINITPLLDIVFIMLIFFIVTTSFVRESGLEVSRPASTPPDQVTQKHGPIVVRIDSSGRITLEGRLLEQRAVRANLERENAGKPGSPLIIAAHPDAQTEALVAVLDAAEAVGVHDVNVATVRQ